MGNEGKTPKKIEYIEYLERVADPATSKKWILKHSIIVRGESGFEFLLKPNEKYVEVSPFERELENAMGAANWAARARRETALTLSLATGDKRPLLVAEGDSWFQFPVLIDEVIDHLGKDYLIACGSAAGDTARNMVYGNQGRGHQEYLRLLWRHRNRVRGFLLSAAGNDVIGEDVQDGDSTPVLQKILKKPTEPNPGVLDIINMTELRKRLDFLEGAYRLVIENIRRLDSSGRPAGLKPFQELPIIIHGYDYAFPYPTPEAIGGVKDTRDPVYADKDQWLGSAFAHHKITDPQLRKDTIVYLVDQLYDMLFDVAGDSKKTQVWVVDCRKTLTKVSDWNDEIHGTDKGFRKISKKFAAVIKDVI